MISLMSAQFWSFPNWGDEDEGNDMNESEDSGEILIYEDEDNYQKLIRLSSSDIKTEKRLLQETSDLIIETIYSEVDEVVINDNIDRISEIISEHTVELYNILHVLETQKEEDRHKSKLKVADIFLWNNDSTNRVNDLIDSFYNS